MQIWPEWDLWGQYLLAMDHKKHKLCCLDISECSATAPISPGHYCQLIPLLGSLEGKAALAGNWTLGIPSSGWELDTRYQRGSHSHQGYHNIHVKELFLFLLFARIWYQEPGSETETAADHLFSSAKQISALASAGNGLQRAQHTHLPRLSPLLLWCIVLCLLHQYLLIQHYTEPHKTDLWPGWARKGGAFHCFLFKAPHFSY